MPKNGKKRVFEGNPENTRKYPKIDPYLQSYTQILNKNRKKSAKICKILPKFDKNRVFFDRFTGRRDHENGKSASGPPGV